MDQNVERDFHGLPSGDFWVFGYGSLMWNPGFAFQEKSAAILYGFKRSLCVWSWHHRGSRANPGLVFGLDKVSDKEACYGCAFHVADEHRLEALRYLKERELITDIYRAATLEVSIEGRQVQALTFIVDPSSVQYAGQIGVAECAQIVRSAKGGSGPNTEYVLETWRYLQQQKIQDEHLECVSNLLQ